MAFDLIGKAVKQLRLPTVNYNSKNVKVIPAQRGDVNSRYISIILFDDRGNICLDSYTMASLNATLPDGQKQNFEGRIDKSTGSLVCKIAGTMLSQVGRVACDVSVFGDDNTCLTSQTFYILVLDSQFDPDADEGNDEVSTLGSLIQEVQKLEKELSEKVDEASEIIDNMPEASELISDWNQNDATKTDYIKNKIPLKNGSGYKSIETDTSEASGWNSKATGHNSQAVSFVACSEGNNTIAGSSGYYVWEINPANLTITVNSIPKSEEHDDVFEYPFDVDYEVGDVITIACDYEWIDCSTITKIEGNIITVDKLPAYYTSTYKWSVKTDRSFVNNTIRCSNKPNVGVVDVGESAHAEGSGTLSIGHSAHGEGLRTKAKGAHSHTEGIDTEAAYSSHSEGRGAKSLGKYCHAEGRDTIAGKIEGADCAHAEGYQTKALGEDAHTEGYKVYVYAGKAHGEGVNNTINENAEASHIEGGGNNITSNGIYAHVEGVSNTGGGHASHTEGQNCSSISQAAHAEGYGTIANRMAAHAEGYGTRAGQEDSSTDKWTGGYAHAEGQNTKALHYSAHAEGTNTIAKANSAHSQGQNTVASGIASHAEGSGAEASGYASHAEGGGTNATGKYSHTGGYKTTAEDDYSFAHGNNVISRKGRTVFGQYNDVDWEDANDVIFALGAGTATNPKTTFAVDSAGNIVAGGPKPQQLYRHNIYITVVPFSGETGEFDESIKGIELIRDSSYQLTFSIINSDNRLYWFNKTEDMRETLSNIRESGVYPFEAFLEDVPQFVYHYNDLCVPTTVKDHREGVYKGMAMLSFDLNRVNSNGHADPVIYISMLGHNNYPDTTIYSSLRVLEDGSTGYCIAGISDTVIPLMTNDLNDIE